MRLYTLTGAAQVDDPQYGKFTANPDGSFDFPNELSDKLHSFAVAGKRAWENDAEREKRIVNEELDRMRDPATLLAAIKEMGSNQSAVMGALAAALGLTPAAAASAPAPTPTVAPAAKSPVADESRAPAAPSKPARSRKSATSSAAAAPSD